MNHKNDLGVIIMLIIELEVSIRKFLMLLLFQEPLEKFDSESVWFEMVFTIWKSVIIASRYHRQCLFSVWYKTGNMADILFFATVCSNMYNILLVSSTARCAKEIPQVLNILWNLWFLWVSYRHEKTWKSKPK